MNDLIKDLCEVLHDLEWWQSGDTSEDSYRKTLAKFKAKWFKGNRKERLKGYIDEQIGIVRGQLYALIGEEDRSVEETETWNGIHAQITAPKGTFDKIFNDAEEDIDDI